MLELSTFNVQRFERNYSSCAGSSSGGAQEKKKDRVKLRKPSKLITVLKN
jgi:hypothetical protein